jgi:hypothetical protein
MHTILAMLHPLTAALRLLRGALLHYGPGVLGKYTMPCAWIISVFCLCAGGYDLVRGRRFDALLWVGMVALLFPAFWMETTLSMHLSRLLALAALAVGVVLLGRTLLMRSPDEA